VNDCREVRDNLSAWLDGELPPAELAAIEQHLAVCPECRAETDCLRRTQRLVGGLSAPPLPRDIVVDLNRAIDADELATRRVVRPFWRRPAAMGSLAAAAMVLLVMTYALPPLLTSQGLTPAVTTEQAPEPATVVPLAGQTVTAPPADDADDQAEAEQIAENDDAPARTTATAPAAATRSTAPTAQIPVETARPAPVVPATIKTTALNAPSRAPAASPAMRAVVPPPAVAPAPVTAPAAAPAVAAPAPTVATAAGVVNLGASGRVVDALRANQASGVSMGRSAISATVPLNSLKRLRSTVALPIQASSVANDTSVVQVTIPLQ